MQRLTAALFASTILCMRTDYIEPSKYNLLYPFMMYDNALALQVALASGMRIGDVLKIKPDDVDGCVVHYQAQKTGKVGEAVLPAALADRLRRNGSSIWCFPHRFDSHKHRTRQAVWKDVKKAAEIVRAAGQLDDQNVAPHSSRKTFAVEDCRTFGAAHTQQLLQHSRRATTEIYTDSDKLVGVPPNYRDNTELLRRINTLDRKLDEVLQLLHSRIVSGCL